MIASPSSRSRAFSLVEVVVAMGVASFCVLVLFGLLPGGIHSNKTTFQQTIAANLAAAVMADLHSAPLDNSSYTPTSTNYSPRFLFSVPQSSSSTPPIQTLFVTDSGVPLTTPNAVPADLPSADFSANNVYRVTVVGPARPTVTGTTQLQRTASPLYILVTWPGQADPTAANWPSHYAGSLETVGYLDQN